MLKVIATLGCMLVLVSSFAQQRDYLRQPPPEEIVKEDSLYHSADARDALNIGMDLFEKGRFIAAEKQLRRAFDAHPDEETARYLYYALMYQGNDLEAAVFKKQHLKYTFALPPVKRGFESIYAEFGPRVAVPADTVGNIYYAAYGGLFRVSDRVRIWHSVGYLQQDDNLGKFKQGDYFSAIYTQLNNGWMLKPAFHYIYTGFTASYRESKNVVYSDTVGMRNPTIYLTTAKQVIHYINPGKSHFAYLSLPVSKRIGHFSVELLPAAHLISSKYSRSYTYVSEGYTDSIRNNEVKGTKQYYETGSGVNADTSELNIIGQLGAAVSWRLPWLKERLVLRAAAFYLFDNDGNSTMAYNATLTCDINNQCRLYATWLRKGALPFALDAEGQYFNHYNPINNRTGLSVQLFPFKQFSPTITYQYEQQERPFDHVLLNYHSVYLTLKYRL